MGTPRLRTTAAITLAAFVAGSLAPSASAASGEEVTSPAAAAGTPGQYIVLMKDDPVATYEGGIGGLPRTKPDQGNTLNARSGASKEYIDYLKAEQDALAEKVGATPDSQYQVTVNGFSAALSGEQVDTLRASKDVLGVFPDEIRHPDEQSSTEYLGLGDDTAGAGGLWDALGGAGQAGEGVVVGVIDTGIAPENPSFAGDALKSKEQSDDQPYTDGQYVYVDKSEGRQFRSRIVAGEGWDATAYSTKLVGAQYFSAGATANGFDFQHDYLSPRDTEGHGSHTASTAAGNFGVTASVGQIERSFSGVAPAAKVSAYKACYSGPEPAVKTDDICASSDLLAAIDQAVADGVDVINYSIGGGSATSVLQPDDIAFMNAAAAGIYVAASAGNDGPGEATADHAAPWYTTVAASSVPTWEATVRFPGFEAAGTSVTVPFGKEMTGPSIYAGDAAVGENANQCVKGSLDPAKAAGHIVVCDRGNNARAEKSQVVKDAGGIGMILVNVPGGADSLDGDFHSLPTVHLSSAFHDEVVSSVRSGTDLPVTLIGENVTGKATPVPQIAGFSSRGPMSADGADILKPDVAAPGVAILAAVGNDPGEKPDFGVMSGTSMAAPHVAGLGALYLGAKPQATPAEIKSALMTTAYDTVNADGSASADAFAQGAGQVDPARMFDPGLLYLNGPDDWKAFLQGKDLADFGVDPIDGSDLNIASIAIGSLPRAQTVTRTVTSTAAGTYTAAIDVPGIAATVSPSTLTFSKPGETATFTVTFDDAGAPVEAWATGLLTWTSADHTVRSPIAVRPTTVDAPAEVSGAGATGSTAVGITPGVTGELPLTLSGLAPVALLTDPARPVSGHSGDERSGDAKKDVSWIVDVPAGVEVARFDLTSSDKKGSDLDLTVSRVASPTDLKPLSRWTSASASADEQVTILAPEAGTYLVVANIYSTSGPMTWDMTHVEVTAGGEGALTATPSPLTTARGEKASYDLSWSGLKPATRYLGMVAYGESGTRTIVTVDVPAEPVRYDPVASVSPASVTAAALGASGVTVIGAGFPPGMPIEILLDGEVVATVTSGADGGLSAVLTREGVAEGGHTVTLRAGEWSASAALAVTAGGPPPTPSPTGDAAGGADWNAALPATGLDGGAVALALAIGGLLALAGGALIVARRRRRG
ncbi:MULTISPECIES: S8 family serine peptidase [Bacteria]|uniref:S8 family serine peptidase n=1 Tax=Bacteria TaxID=2 RepID=UPI003C7BB47B